MKLARLQQTWSSAPFRRADHSSKGRLPSSSLRKKVCSEIIILIFKKMNEWKYTKLPLRDWVSISPLLSPSSFLKLPVEKA